MEEKTVTAAQAAANAHAIQKQDLAEEIAAALQDCFVAKIDVTDAHIHLRFVNGQRFTLTLDEE